MLILALVLLVGIGYHTCGEAASQDYGVEQSTSRHGGAMGRQVL
jgi:hypothetical protein